MLMLALVAKIITSIPDSDWNKAIYGIGYLIAIAIILVASTRLASDKDIKSASNLIFSVGAAMLMLALVAKITSSITPEDMNKAIKAVGYLAMIIIVLIASTNLASDKDLKKVGTTLLMMSISIGILALIATVLGFVPIENLSKGVIAVGILGLIIAIMIASTKNAQNCKGNIRKDYFFG